MLVQKLQREQKCGSIENEGRDSRRVRWEAQNLRERAVERDLGDKDPSVLFPPLWRVIYEVEDRLVLRGWAQAGEEC